MQKSGSVAIMFRSKISPKSGLLCSIRYVSSHTAFFGFQILFGEQTKCDPAQQSASKSDCALMKRKACICKANIFGPAAAVFLIAYEETKKNDRRKNR